MNRGGEKRRFNEGEAVERQLPQCRYRDDRADIATHSECARKYGRLRRLPGINHNRKGLRPDQAKKATARPRPGHRRQLVAFAANMVRTTSGNGEQALSLIHISEPTRQAE